MTCGPLAAFSSRQAARSLKAAIIVAICICHSGIAHAQQDKTAAQTDGKQTPQQGDVLASGLQLVEQELNKDNSESDDISALIDNIQKGAADKDVSPTQKVEIDLSVKQAREEVKWSKQKLNQAREALEKARKEKNEAVRRVYLKEAMLKSEEARRWKQRVKAALNDDPPAAGAGKPTADEPVAGGPVNGGNARQQPRGGPRHPSRLNLGLPKTWSTLRQAQRAAGLSKSQRDAEAFGEASAGNRPIADYDEKRQVVETLTGQFINVAPLAEAVQTTSGQPAQSQQLFEKVETPDGRQGYQLKPSVMKKLASERTRKELHKVGGVALDVTLDLLSYAGVSEFRRNGPARIVEKPTLISMSRLYSRLRDFAGAPGDWEKLSAELRFPGSIERIHGFIIDEATPDVILIGAPASAPHRRIDVDTLISMFKSVWLLGNTPAVSLDPIPERFSGPQFSKIIDIPPDSLAAKVMLDADYAMKRIVFGLLDTGVKGFNELWIKQFREGRSFTGRFWLVPAPVSFGDVAISASQRTVLFESAVRLRTESMAVRGAQLVGLGTINKSAQKMADLFTGSYGVFEESKQITPEGIFLKLHGLVDQVIVCRFLRAMGIDYPVLKAFASLPVRQLKGEEGVPEYYPGVTRKFGVGSSTWTLSGGAVLRMRPNGRTLERYYDFVTQRLEQVADAFRESPDIMKTASITLRLPKPRQQTASELERAVLAGNAAMRQKDFKLAEKHFARAVKIDPAAPEGWASLAGARARLKKSKQAIRNMQRAVDLDPSDPDLALGLLELKLIAARDPEFSAAERKLLCDESREFSREGLGLLLKGEKAAAQNFANIAIRMCGGNADAYFLRSRTWDDDLGNKAFDDREQAIRHYRRLHEADPTLERKRDLSLVLSLDANLRLFRVRQGTQHVSKNKTQIIKELREEIIPNAREARKLNADSPWPWQAETLAGMMLGTLAGNTDVLRSAEAIGEKMVTRFADFPDGHVALASVRIFLDEDRKALRGLTKAIRMDPTYARAYIWRATVYENRGRHIRAVEDYTQVLGLPGLSDFLKAIALGGRCTNLGQAELYEDALKDCEAALKIDPTEKLLEKFAVELRKFIADRKRRR